MIGSIEGGAASAVGALEDAVGQQGLILMPSFNFGKAPEGGDTSAYRAERWDIDTTPSTVGYLTEFFRTMEGTFRSNHYSHSVAARGRKAEEFVAGHMAQDGLDSPWDREPWGKTYGTHSPMMRAYQAGGKLLMLGTDYSTSTYCHIVEVLWWHRRREKEPDAAFVPLDREALGEEWERTPYVRTGRVGKAACRLFPIKQYVDALLAGGAADQRRWQR